MNWITLTVLNQRFEVESEIEILKSEICLLQQYSLLEDVLHPGIPESGVPAALEKGHPAFCAVSLKSGLQFRVAQDAIVIRSIL